MGETRGPYHDVRSLKRGLRILEVLGQVGWVKPTVLGMLTGIDRSSTYRLLNTLAESGYVIKREEDGAFSLTVRVKLLADGFTQSDRLSQIVAPHLQRLTAEISWPCDFAVLVGGEAVIVESTHRLSPMSLHRAMIGKRRSLMSSALGRAILCSLTDDEREITLKVIEQLGGGDAASARDRKYVRQILDDYARNGYTGSNGLVDTKVAAIGAPVRASGSVVGAVNIIFFRSALTIVQAAERYLPNLRHCVLNIERELLVDEPEKSHSNGVDSSEPESHHAAEEHKAI